MMDAQLTWHCEPSALGFFMHWGLPMSGPHRPGKEEKLYWCQLIINVYKTELILYFKECKENLDGTDI